MSMSYLTFVIITSYYASSEVIFYGDCGLSLKMAPYIHDLEWAVYPAALNTETLVEHVWRINSEILTKRWSVQKVQKFIFTKWHNQDSKTFVQLHRAVEEIYPCSRSP